MAFQEETEALLTSLRNLASLACLVNATSIKDINSGLLNEAGTHKKAILSHLPSMITSYPQLTQGNYALRWSSKECLGYCNPGGAVVGCECVLNKAPVF